MGRLRCGWGPDSSVTSSSRRLSGEEIDAAAELKET